MLERIVLLYEEIQKVFKKNFRQYSDININREQNETLKQFVEVLKPVYSVYLL